jgi:CarD family transcriptional regulator
MPVKNNPTPKAAAAKVETSKAKVSKVAVPQMGARVKAGSTEKPKSVPAAATKPAQSKPAVKAGPSMASVPSKAAHAAKSNPAKPSHGKSAVAANTSVAAQTAPLKSAGVQRLAAVSTQKNDTTKSPLQPRTPMASSSASKIAQQSKTAAPQQKASLKAAVTAPMKAADSKAPVGKAAGAKPTAPIVKVVSAKVIAAPATPMAAARAPEARPASARAMPAAVGAATAQRISAPAAPAPVAPVAAGVVTPKDIAQKAQQAAAATSKKPVNARHGFKINELVVYPAHGVGRIVGIEEQEIAGMALELFVITFEKDKMTLRVPTGRSQSVMRKLAEDGVVKRAMETLKGKARIKRTMWSRRAQEFEQKINSGDLVSIAEVVRDLFRAETQPEQSYSERQLYEAALDRMAREIAAVEKIDERGAVQRVTEGLSKSAKSRRAESDAAAPPAGDIKAA